MKIYTSAIYQMAHFQIQPAGSNYRYGKLYGQLNRFRIFCLQTKWKIKVYLEFFYMSFSDNFWILSPKWL